MNNRLKLLLIESNPGDVGLVFAYLAEDNACEYAITPVDSLRDATEEIKKADYDLILMDIMLPGISGIEAVRAITDELDELVPIIILTGYTDQQTATEIIKNDAQDYLVKDEMDAPSLSRTIRYTLERFNSQNDMRRLVDVSPTGILVLDENNQVLFSNTAARSILSGENTDSIADVLACCGEEGEGGQYEPSKDKTLSVQKVRTMWQGTQAVFLLMTDITEEKRFQNQIAHSQRLESMGLLAGGVAHDFNNLLTAIMGNASLVVRKVGKDSDLLTYMDRIKSASQSAADLCRQMLAYSGKGRFVVKKIDLNESVTEISRLFEVSMGKGVSLTFNLSHQPVYMEGDAAQIQQIIMNLITNAAEAVGDEVGVVTVTTAELNATEEYLTVAFPGEALAAGRYVILEVSDTGCGMSSETLGKLFDPFFTTKFFGRGLGMSAVQGIVHGHSGAISVNSEEGVGTTFKLIFPAADEALHVDELGVLSHHQGVSHSGVALVVDDEQPIREMATEMLHEIGFEVQQASNGISAIKIFASCPDLITLVLLDMSMPNMSGEECYQSLKNINPNVKVILTSAYNEQEVTSRFSKQGLAGFLQKPYTRDQLAEKVYEALKR